MNPVMFFQAFDGEAVRPLPYRTVIECLAPHAKFGRGRGDLEFTSEFAHCGIIVGDSAKGVLCIGLERAVLGAPLQNFAFELMKKLACCLFDDALEMAYWVDGAPLPHNLAEASLGGVRKVSLPQQLWPTGLTWQPPRTTPALRYTNPNPHGKNFVFFDELDADTKALIINLRARPEACNAGTMRVLRNLLLRVDDAHACNPDHSVTIRCTNKYAWSLILTSPKLVDTASNASIVSPSPFDPREQELEFQVDFDAHYTAGRDAATIIQIAKTEHKLKLDGTSSTLPALERLIDQLHQRLRRAIDGGTVSDEQFTELAGRWAVGVGNYYGGVLRWELGAQWGNAQVLRTQARALKFHAGGFCLPALLVLDRIVNGGAPSLTEHYRLLRSTAKSLTDSDVDFAGTVPDNCVLLLHDPHKQLPLSELIPGRSLDYSLESLKKLDEYLLQVMRQRGKFKSIAITMLIVAAGSYVGEVIRRRLGSGWWWENFNDRFRGRKPPEDFQQSKGTAAMVGNEEALVLPFQQVIDLLHGGPDQSTSGFAERTLKQYMGKTVDFGTSVVGNAFALKSRLQPKLGANDAAQTEPDGGESPSVVAALAENLGRPPAAQPPSLPTSIEQAIPSAPIRYADVADVRQGDAVLVDGDSLPAEMSGFQPMTGWFPARVCGFLLQPGQPDHVLLEVGQGKDRHQGKDRYRLRATATSGALTLVQRDSQDYAADSIAWLRARAAEGDARARFGLGILTSLGRHVTADPALGLSLLKAAAAQQEPRAVYHLGSLYGTGRQGLQNDMYQALQCYRRAAMLGYAPAQFFVGLAHQHGRGVGQNLAEALKWYRQAAAQGNTAAQLWLGTCLVAGGDGLPRDPKEAATWFRCAADAGDMQAQFALGVRYEAGDGVEKNAAEAVRWYELSAEQGFGPAMCNLADKCEHGRGLPRDLPRAVALYKAAAEKDVPAAMFGLGLMYKDGRGVERSRGEAIHWFECAVEANYSDAAAALAEMRGDLGDDTAGPTAPTDAEAIYKKARELYHPDQPKLMARSFELHNQAAALGHVEGQFQLGFMYRRGLGTSRDLTQAVFWYSKAADAGDHYAQQALGELYETGEGVEKNERLSQEWYRKAAVQGNVEAQGKIKKRAW